MARGWSWVSAAARLAFGSRGELPTSFPRPATSAPPFLPGRRVHHLEEQLFDGGPGAGGGAGAGGVAERWPAGCL